MIHLAKVFFLNADFYVVTWYRWELVHTFLTSDKDDLFQVSYLGTVHLEVIAKRLSLPDNLVRGAGVELRIWLKQGKEKRLLARILKILEKARKRLSRQN